MKPNWQKLASLAHEICTLWFQFFGAVFASKGYPFKIILVNYNCHPIEDDNEGRLKGTVQLPLFCTGRRAGFFTLIMVAWVSVFYERLLYVCTRTHHKQTGH